MKISLISVEGKKGTKTIFQESLCSLGKQLSIFCDLELIVLKSVKSSKSFSVEKCMAEEGKSILKYMDNGGVNVLLDENGKEMSSMKFSEFLGNYKSVGKRVNFIIGGAFGVSDAVKNKADVKVALSKMTFTHQMAKLFLLEQIYRGFCILSGKEYHHE